MLGKAGRSEKFPGLNEMLTPCPSPPSPQASAYLKQNKYQQAEELYKEILSQEALPAPLGAPQGGTAGGAQQQVLRRSSSFSKLRESIRRGSEKLVSRLRGESMAGAAG